MTLERYRQAAKDLPGGALCEAFCASADPLDLSQGELAAVLGEEAAKRLNPEKHEIAKDVLANMGPSGGEGGTRAGRIDRNNAAAATNAAQEREKKRQKTDDLTYLILMLDRQIYQIDMRLGEIDEQLQALEELERLCRTDQFDADNPDHRALMEKAGITAEQIENNPEEIFTHLRGNLHEEREQLLEQRAELQAEHDVLVAENAEVYNPDDVRDIEFLEAQRKQILEKDEQKERIESKISEIEEDLVTESEPLSIDEEIGEFSRSYAETLKIEDHADRLKAQQKIVSELSEDAAFELELEEEYAALFEPDYFEALEEKSQSSNEENHEIAGSFLKNEPENYSMG